MIVSKVDYQGRSYYNVDPNDTQIPADIIKAALIDEAWRLVRTKRDNLIAKTDYAIMPDYPLTDAQKADVTAYRQSLRDIPENFTSPDAVEWPATPEILTL